MQLPQLSLEDNKTLGSTAFGVAELAADASLRGTVSMRGARSVALEYPSFVCLSRRATCRCDPSTEFVCDVHGNLKDNS